MNYSSLSVKQQSPEPALLGVGDVVDFVRRRWLVFFVAAAFCFGLFAVAAFTIPPVYTATARVLLEVPQESMLGRDAAASRAPFGPEFVESQIAVLTSTALLQEVVRSESLRKEPDLGAETVQWLKNALSVGQFGPPDGEVDTDPERDALDWLSDSLKVSQFGVSNAIDVTVAAKDKEKAASIANAIVEAYVMGRMESRFESGKRASLWLNDRIHELQEELRRSEHAVEDFRIEHGMLETPAGRFTEQQLTELNSALINARAEAADKRSRYEHAERLLAGDGDIETIAEVLSAPVVTTLRSDHAAVVRREADLLSRYGQRHPDVVTVRAERQSIESQIRSEAERVIAQMRSDVDLAERRETAWVQSLTRASDQSGAEGQLAVQLRELERIAAANRSVYESFLLRARTVREEANLPAPEARVITAASVPSSPSFPDKRLFLALGLVLGVAVGGGVALLREAVGSAFIARRQVEEALDVPVLALIPRMPTVVGERGREALHRTHHFGVATSPRYSEAVQQLKFRAGLIDPTGSPRVTLVTSALPGEGKTTVAMSLAFSAAAAGDRVLLIDADLRISSVTSFFDMGSCAGLVDILTVPAEPARVIQFDERSNIHVLAAGVRTLNRSKLLGSRRMRSLIEQLRSDFDVIIIDSPPVAPLIDAVVLSQCVDQVLFAVKWSETSQESVVEAMQQLAGTRIAGIALNMVDERRLPRHGRYASLESSVASDYYGN